MNLTAAAEDLLQRSVAWMDRYWDEARDLLWEMGDVAHATGSSHAAYHIVRESAWYALGLLVRDRAGDVRHAVQALEAVLSYQFDEPGRVYHGTFLRAPEEPHPPAIAVEWKHYDPNWREFIITTISVILNEFEDRLPRPLIAQIDATIRRAVEGALARPLSARYTNIALMNAHMLVWAGARLREPRWAEAGEAMGREVYCLFKQHDAFEEYNSPTYYGPDIYALGLWQAYCPSPPLHRMAAEMEALLWRDIALFYHAGLRNMAGPYDRAYGMDMCRYVALLGMWIWLITGREHAPFPDVRSSFSHAADFCFGPLVATLGLRVPSDVIPHFTGFQGERCIERAIGDSPNQGVTGRQRTVTAWLGEQLPGWQVMIGGQHTSMSDIGQGQFHPATIHWRTPQGAANASTGGVGWIRLSSAHPVDAVAGRLRLAVRGPGPLTFQIHAPQLAPASVQPDHWRLPGLEVRIDGNVPGVMESTEEDVLVRYAGDGGEVCAELHLSFED